MDKHKQNQVALKGGSYSVIITVVVLAVLVVVNILASVLPGAITKYDISASKLYSITSATKVVVNALEKDVTIYWIVQADEEDSVIENLLEKYDSLSSHIDVVKKNPDIYPTFAAQYTDETVANNSLVVECGDRSRYIGYDDIYLIEADMSSYYYSGSYDVSFDGEGAITSAIDYVVSEDLPQLYLLEGHGEAELPTYVSEQIQKENIDVTSFSLLTEDSVPEEADCVLIYSPASDISPEEKDMLAEYAAGGGKLMVIAGATEEGTLENLYGLLADYGIEAAEGVVVEEDRGYYAFQQPYILLPEIASSDMTDPLIAENYYVIMPIAQGLVFDSSSTEVMELLSTSPTSFSKTAGYALTTYEKEEGDTDGAFAVGVSVECGGGGQMVWFTSSYFLDEMYNAYSSGANLELAMNAISSLIGEREAIAIRSKAIDYNYLTISESDASRLKTIMIGICPILYLGFGVFMFVERRKRNG
ncbi:MAG: GldG family protein [Lachnospiraceae bacterium]|nr:GldG family protein [Muribaculaceae bacterium]MCM1411884.1 GldG family protein [Lachnospiraceae bacterium]